MPTFLVTGSNRGIGLEYCRQLQARGDQVIAVCRTPSPELEALGVRLEAGIELTAEADLDSLQQRLAGQPLDGVILNAGILEANRLENLDSESLRRQFEVNALAPLRLVAALLPNLQPGSKLALMTSRMGSIDDNSSGSSYGYRMSKGAGEHPHGQFQPPGHQPRGGGAGPAGPHRRSQPGNQRQLLACQRHAAALVMPLKRPS
jgi:NAD(P)-dependent dehydrogenase (short-subunit alcohol dehydrogenase family)